MGQDQSLPVDESIRPQTLRARSVEAVAKYILSGRAKKIMVMVRSLPLVEESAHIGAVSG